MKVICPSCNKDLTRFAPKELDRIEVIECSCGFVFQASVEYIVTGYAIEYVCDHCSMFVSLSQGQVHQCREES